jgi:hypothetical protein
MFFRSLMLAGRSALRHNPWACLLKAALAVSLDAGADTGIWNAKSA